MGSGGTKHKHLAKRCVYCGRPNAKSVDHVVPRSLYPPSQPPGRFQRITVPACLECNNGFADDEVHFRNVVTLAGEATLPVQIIWREKVRPSFDQPDRARRLRELLAQIVPVSTPDGPRHAIYPAENDRVLRVVRKIVRGLCHYHNLLSPVADAQVWADIQRFAIPEEFLNQMTSADAEAHILQYRYGMLDQSEIHSGWQLTFYERTPFQCIVFHSIDARNRFDNPPDSSPDV